MGITDYLSRTPNASGPEDKSLTQEITICQLNFLNDWKNLNLEKAIWNEATDPLLPKSRKSVVHKNRKVGSSDVKRKNFGEGILEPMRMLDLVKRTKANLLEETVNDQSSSIKTIRNSDSLSATELERANFGGSKPHFRFNRKDSHYFNCNLRELSRFQKKRKMSSQDSDGEVSQVGELTKARANVLLAALDEVRQTGKVVMSEGSIRPHKLSKRERRREAKLEKCIAENYNRQEKADDEFGTAIPSEPLEFNNDTHVREIICAVRNFVPGDEQEQAICRGLVRELTEKSDINLPNLVTETDKDTELRNVRQAIVDKRYDLLLAEFRKKKDLLSTELGVVFMDSKIVTPRTLKEWVLQFIHRDHEGVPKMRLWPRGCGGPPKIKTSKKKLRTASHVFAQVRT